MIKPVHCRYWLLLSGLLVVSQAAFADDHTGILRLHVDGLRSAQGQIVVSLFKNEKGFPINPQDAQAIVTCNISARSADHHFASLPYGYYALACFHDENGNGRFDTGLFGIPLEGVGASNGAKGFMGPPHWKDAKILFNQDTVTCNINLQYVF